MNQPKNILFKLTGSIACYKACAVISGLVQKGYQVQTAASPSALKFIGEATLEGLTGQPVLKDLWQSGRAMDHIHAVRAADLIVVAPATANFVNSIANGLGQDLLTTMSLAHDFKKPYLIAPAMNGSMLNHPTTQASLKKLKIMGYSVLPTESGSLACGETGEGRFLAPETLLQEIEAALGVQNQTISASNKGVNVSQKRLRILVTAGGTQIPIDSVRAITNSSTGRTGARLAQHLLEQGHDVTLLLSAGGRKENYTGATISYSTVTDLEKALRDELSQRSYDLVVHAAAISDFMIKDIQSNHQPITSSGFNKIQSDQDVTIQLTPGPKLIQHIQQWSQNKNVGVIAFKLTADANPFQVQQAVSKVFYNPGVIAVIHNDQKGIQEGNHRFNLWLDPEHSQAQFGQIEEAIDYVLKQSTSEKKGGVHDTHP